MEICTVTFATVGDVVPLFNAYREFYGQPSDLEQAEQFLLERLNKEESVIFSLFGCAADWFCPAISYFFLCCNETGVYSKRFICGRAG